MRELLSSGSLLVKILMMTLLGLALGGAYSFHFLKLALSSRDLLLFHERP